MFVKMGNDWFDTERVDEQRAWGALFYSAQQGNLFKYTGRVINCSAGVGCIANPKEDELSLIKAMGWFLYNLRPAMEHVSSAGGDVVWIYDNRSEKEDHPLGVAIATKRAQEEFNKHLDATVVDEASA
jgi:hypothetical protein